MSAIPPAVERGAEYLDAIRPGWASEIDLNELDLSQCENCILGQLYGDYDRAEVSLGLSRREAVRFGFLPRGGDAYRRLTAGWVWLIAGRNAS